MNKIDNDWIKCPVVDGKYQNSSLPKDKSFVIGKLKRSGSVDNILVAQIYFDGEGFRHTEHSDIAWEWDVVAWKPKKEPFKKYTPEKITSLNPSQVFVFGSNKSGFHGAGAAGLALRGDSKNTWRQDSWFLKAKASPKGSADRIGKWAVFGQGRGFQKGKEGSSYAIETIEFPGRKKSTPLSEIRHQLVDLIQFAYHHPHLDFLVVKLGCHLAGYSVKDVSRLFCSINDEFLIPHNVILPQEFECRF